MVAWQLEPIVIGDDEQLVIRPPHLQYGESRAVPHCSGRQQWDDPFGLELPPQTRARCFVAATWPMPATTRR